MTPVMAIRTVIDTNVLVASLSSKSIHHWLVRQLLEEKIDLFVTGEIMLEYEEVLKQKILGFCRCKFSQCFKGIA